MLLYDKKRVWMELHFLNIKNIFFLLKKTIIPPILFTHALPWISQGGVFLLPTIQIKRVNLVIKGCSKYPWNFVLKIMARQEQAKSIINREKAK